MLALAYITYTYFVLLYGYCEHCFKARNTYILAQLILLDFLLEQQRTSYHHILHTILWLLHSELVSCSRYRRYLGNAVQYRSLVVPTTSIAASYRPSTAEALVSCDYCTRFLLSKVNTKVEAKSAQLAAGSEEEAFRCTAVQ